MKLGGWWAQRLSSRFAFPVVDHFDPVTGAAGWQASNPPPLLLATLSASLEVWSQAGLQRIVDKAELLTLCVSPPTAVHVLAWTTACAPIAWSLISSGDRVALQIHAVAAGEQRGLRAGCGSGSHSHKSLAWRSAINPVAHGWGPRRRSH